jgi:hypothetical protein
MSSLDLAKQDMTFDYAERSFALRLDDPDALIARVREQLGEPAFAAAWAQGESLPLDQAIAEADAVLAEVAQGDHGG